MGRSVTGRPPRVLLGSTITEQPLLYQTCSSVLVCSITWIMGQMYFEAPKDENSLVPGLRCPPIRLSSLHLSSLCSLWQSVHCRRKVSEAPQGVANPAWKLKFCLDSFKASSLGPKTASHLPSRRFWQPWTWGSGSEVADSKPKLCTFGGG